MNKDAFYFPHDSNAKDDPKCVLLIEQLGLEGYGIFWVLIETLRDQPEYKYPLILIPALARRYNTTAEKMKAVIHAYDLFKIQNDEFFLSESLINRMIPLEEKRKKRSAAGKLGNSIRWNNQLELPIANESQCDRKKSLSKVEESKEEESIEENNKSNNRYIIPPTIKMIREYCENENINIDPQLFFDHYETRGWIPKGYNRMMKDWHAAIRTWVKNNNKFNNGNYQKDSSERDLRNPGIKEHHSTTWED